MNSTFPLEFDAFGVVNGPLVFVDDDVAVGGGDDGGFLFGAGLDERELPGVAPGGEVGDGLCFAVGPLIELGLCGLAGLGLGPVVGDEGELVGDGLDGVADAGVLEIDEVPIAKQADVLGGRKGDKYIFRVDIPV